MSKHIRQIVGVLTAIRDAQPTTPEQVRVARIDAVGRVTREWGVDWNTVNDGCQRRLGLSSISDFDRLVEKWLNAGDTALISLLEQHAGPVDRQGDLREIARLRGEVPPAATTAPPPDTLPTSTRAPARHRPSIVDTHIPDYQTLMLPLLRLAGDRREQRIAEAIDVLADEFRLTPQQRAAVLPSGRQPVIDNRAHWARTYLRHGRAPIHYREAVSSPDRG